MGGGVVVVALRCALVLRTLILSLRSRLNWLRFSVAGMWILLVSRKQGGRVLGLKTSMGGSYGAQEGTGGEMGWVLLLVRSGGIWLSGWIVKAIV